MTVVEGRGISAGVLSDAGTYIHRIHKDGGECFLYSFKLAFLDLVFIIQNKFTQVRGSKGYN